jgi:undecaprenyl-diphosphatase
MNTLIIFGAKYLYLIVVVLLVVVWLMGPAVKRWKLSVNGLVTLVLAFGLTKLAGMAYYDPRPFVAGHFTPLVAHAANNGFPSDHTVFTMAIALSVWQVSRRWGAVLVVGSLLVGVSRIGAGIHSLLDVAGSVGIAVVAALVACWVGPMVLRRLRSKMAAETAEAQ